MEPFSVPLPIPPVLQPVRSDPTGDYYELTMRSGRAQLRDGPATEIWGFDGMWPGPTIRATRGRPTHVRATNLMSRDMNIHNHGHKIPAESDGGPLDVIRPGESRTYVYPNDQNASTYWYHDHTMTNAEAIYRGMAGFYLITDPAEDAFNLASGAYDIPIPRVLQPVRSDASGDYYELTMRSGRAQLRDGAATEIWGFDGIWPGPTIRATRGRPTHVRATNLMSREVNIHDHGHKVPAQGHARGACLRSHSC